MVFLELKDIKKFFPVRHGFLKKTKSHIKAADGINLTIEKSKNLGIVGESGCGKSTLARIITKLIKADFGKIIFQGQDITNFSCKQMKPVRKNIQIVFQDPFNSLDPRFSVSDIIKEAFIALGERDSKDINERIKQLVNIVELPADCLNRYPYEFSGGERQRIAIARALVARPQLLILDEAVSSLDILLQSQILNLLYQLQEQFNLTYLFISHNLRVIKRMTYRVAIMYLGKIVEIADTRDVFTRPLHPYTKALLVAAIELKVALKGELSLGVDIPSGCRFHPRCPYRQRICEEVQPELKQRSTGHFLACHFPLLEDR